MWVDSTPESPCHHYDTQQNMEFENFDEIRDPRSYRDAQRPHTTDRIERPQPSPAPAVMRRVVLSTERRAHSSTHRGSRHGVGWRWCSTGRGYGACVGW